MSSMSRRVVKGGLLFLLLLLPAISRCKPAPAYRKGWGSRLDLREKNVQEFLQHNKLESTTRNLAEHGSGIYYNEFRYDDDSEPGDSIDEEEERELRLQAKEKSNCIHPKTHQKIGIGSFDFDEKSCMMCECPAGKITCYKTC